MKRIHLSGRQTSVFLLGGIAAQPCEVDSRLAIARAEAALYRAKH